MDSNHSGDDSVQTTSVQDKGFIFFCDVTAEAGQLMMKLRLLGYTVVDVPLATLATRTALEPPALVICDAEASEVVTKIEAARTAATVEFGVVLLAQLEADMSAFHNLKDHETFFRPVDVTQLEKIVRKRAGPPEIVSDDQRHRQSSQMRRASLLAPSFRRSSSIPALHIRDLPGLNEDELPDKTGAESDSNSGGPEPRIVYQSIVPADLAAHDDDTRFSLMTHTLLNNARVKVAENPIQPPRPERLGQGLTGENIEQRFIDALREPLEDEAAQSEQTGTANHGPHSNLDQLTSAGGKRISELPLEPKLEPVSPYEPSGLNTLLDRTQSLELQKKHRPLVAPQLEDLPFARERLLAIPAEQRPTTAPRAPVHDEPSMGRLKLPLEHEGEAPDCAESQQVQGDAIANSQNHAMGALISTIPPQTGPRQSQHKLLPLQQNLDTPDLFLTAEPAEPQVVTPSVVHSAEPDRPLKNIRDTFEAGQTAPMVGLLGLMIRERRSGSIAEEQKDGIRRVLFRDGDILTLHSSAPEESLVAFLKATSVITGDTAAALASMPSAGRYAGAALIARGVLSQEELWGTLRAHAEWLLARMILDGAAATHEVTAPQQLAEEPAVFGGSAGSEIFVDAVKRVTSAERAVEALGGVQRTVGRGSYELLRSETALPERELHAATSCLGQDVATIFKTQPTLLVTIYALTELGIFSTGVPNTAFVSGSPRETAEEQQKSYARLDQQTSASATLAQKEFRQASQQLDLEAYAARLDSHLRFVKDGNYFQILGIPYSCTAYEVQRAAARLRSAFSEADLVVAQLELSKNIQRLIAAVAEAEVVLKDDTRRERYRLALEQHP